MRPGSKVYRRGPLALPPRLHEIIGIAGDERQYPLARQRLLLTLFRIFSGLTMLLAGLGVHAVTSHSVRGRRWEVGLWMAPGADRRLMVHELLRRGLLGVASGLVAGLVGAALLGRAISSLLFAVAPLDPVSFLSASALLFALSFISTLWPAWRASRVAPAEGLHSD